MPSRDQLIRIHKKILEGIQAEARAYMGRKTPALEKYYKDYEKDFKKMGKISSKPELIQDILRSHIVYSGDYHTFIQAQKIPLRILREVIKRKKKIMIGVEMMMSEHQQLLDEFLNGNVTESEFLEDIHYERHWGFQWQHFKPLFDFAKTQSLRILALNCRPNPQIHTGLAELVFRDRWAAQLIAKASQENPDTLLYVIFGDLHLAQSHLPLEVALFLKEQNIKRNTLTIHQNNEKLYWQLVKRKLEDRVDIVKLEPHIYGIANAAPWLKLLSYIHWIEKPEQYDQIYEIIKIVAHFFKRPLKGLSDYHVYTAEQEKVIGVITAYVQDHPAWARYVKAVLKHAESYFIPRENIIYLKTLSINHAAEEATIFMYCHAGGVTRFPVSPEEIFYQNLYLKCLGFLGSKMMNPKRRCEKEADFEGRKQDPAAKLVLVFLKREKQYLRGFKFNATLPQIVRLSPKHSYEVSKCLGYLLGEKLYLALKLNRLSLKDVCKLFEIKLNSYVAIEQYLYWLRKLEGIRVQYQEKKDRL
ncbi:MAG: ChaN family lipoprotein [Deltaproteobacteria bacterium]|nr:ChaN family lipoprotein [Deltaproteobacteria bacterium]